ncbi:uncharacterized protein LOC143282766 isoform X2 [Babylonia areolata]|uniref:uncharacterized protein LOC143282766 isoform X2 n=1 Tax=Babylonia areolata TaxID=304850 RepID=UPI003FD3EAED
MSQSAENQSAMIENENNFNIAVESQAAESESSCGGVNLQGISTADDDPGTPTQDEVEERTGIDEGQGDSEIAAGSDAHGESIAGAGDADLKNEESERHAKEEDYPQAEEASESQDASESRSPQIPAEGQDEQVAAEETMEVDEHQPEEAEQMEEHENVCSEPDLTNLAQEDNDSQQDADQETEGETFDCQAEPACTEAETDSNLAVAQNAVYEEDQNLQMEETEGELVESGMQNEDQNLAMDDAAEGQESESNTQDDGQILATEEAQQAEDERPEDNQYVQMYETEQDQQVESERTEDDQYLAMDDAEQSQQADFADEGQDLGEKSSQDEQQADADSQMLADEGGQDEQADAETQMLADEGGQDEQADAETQMLADEGGQDEQADAETQMLADEGGQDEQQADAESQLLDSESPADNDLEGVDVYQPDSSIIEATDPEAEMNDNACTNEGDATAVDDTTFEVNDYEVGNTVSNEAEKNETMAEDVSADCGETDAGGNAVEEVPDETGESMGESFALPEEQEPSSQPTGSVSDVNEHDLDYDSKEKQTTDGGEEEHDTEATEMHQEADRTSLLNTENTESKSSDGLDKFIEDSDQTMDPEADRASDATIVEGRDIDDEPMLQVTDIKSGADAEEGLDERPDSARDINADDTNMDTSATSEAVDTETAGRENNSVEESDVADEQTYENAIDRTEVDDAEKKASSVDDDDVVVLDDDEEGISQVKKEGPEKEVLNSNNDMGIQIESVSGGANDVHGYNEHTDVKQENADQKPVATPKTDSKGNAASGRKSSRTQTCIVCKKVGKCKYNIVRNGDIKHLCDDACFKRFRANPTIFLKGTGTGGKAAAADKKSGDVKPPAGVPVGQGVGKPVPGYKTCTVCLVMNINSQGQFCVWKGLDFCGEGCLGKFQSGISSSCALCTAFIPLASRSTHCLRLGSQMKPFCSNRCHVDYKLRLRLCTQCQKDAASAPDSFFSAPVGSDGTFKDFCSQACMKKFEEVLNIDVEILRVEPGKPITVNKCSVCHKKEIIKYNIKYKGTVHQLCSDPCLSAFQYTNKVDLHTCDFCSALCTSRESSIHTVQFEGHQKHFCSDKCVNKFRASNRKVSPCSWCGTQRDNFDMIERLDSSSKYQLFCSLNCLSLYRVNLQAKSNQPVTCDQCSKRAPAQYHLTMSDASVRNFCSYNCVMTFQAQFSKGPQPAPPAPAASAPPPPPPPKHKHNTRGRAGRGRQQSPATSPSFPIISNVISLAPQGGQQQVNIKNSTGMPVMVGGANQSVKTTGVSSQAPVQQQIIIQPPPPKPMKNKSILCKPFVQTKATSCRPHTQSKECQTDEVKQKPALVPVPIPVYMPAPMAMYSAPAPTPIFVPIPIPVPIFIPTTRKSANGILKQIKEIREKTPSDPLEAELLMMAAAVSADGKNSSDSESDEEVLPEINRSRKRLLPADDDDDADVMPLSSNKEEEGGEEDMISMALRMAEEMSGPITDLESAVEAVPVNTEPPPQPPRSITPDTIAQEEEMIRNRRGGKRGGTARRGGAGRPPKRPRIQVPQPEPIPMRQEPPPPPPPPADANYHLKFTYGVNAWRHWVLFKNNQIERNMKPGCGRVKLFKTDIMQCTADELNFSLCLFVKEVRKPNGDEYSPDSIYYLCLGIQQYLFENGRIDNIFTDFYYERFTECLTQILSKCQPKFNASGQMVCRIEEEHLWECKQLGAHSPYVLLNTLIYFHTKYFMLKTPEDHMKLSFAHILKYWKKGQPGKGGQPARSVSLRYYSVSTAKKDGSAPTSATKKGSKDGIPVYEVTENQENPLRCPVKLYEFYLSKCPESIKNRSDIFYPVPERSCVPDSPVWYSTMPISLEVMTKMLTRILLVREIQEAHLHAQPIYV